MKKIRILQLFALPILFLLLIFLSGFSKEGKHVVSQKQLKLAASDNTNSNTNPDYLNRYKKIESYIPDENITVKHIKIAVNIFTGPGTIQKSDSTVDAVRQIVNWLNGFYKDVDSTTYPIPGVQRLTDTKIRFDIDDRIFFYEGTNLYNNTSINTLENYIAGIDSARLDNLNIYFTAAGAASPYALPPYPRFILKEGSGNTVSSLYSNQGVYISSASLCYVNAQSLGHELGHCLDLFHTYNPSCCHETCDSSDPEYLYDVFGTNPPDYCWEIGGFGRKITPGKNTYTNNAMGGVNTLYCYFSPMQIGKMHRALCIKTVRKYVKEDAYDPIPHEINKNETWNFDIRWYSEIVIKSGAVLTVTGKILMADQGQIIIERGAKLIVDGGVITSSGKTWQGIKLIGKRKIKQQLFTAKDGLILKNGAVIENVQK